MCSHEAEKPERSLTEGLCLNGLALSIMVPLTHRLLLIGSVQAQSWLR